MGYSDADYASDLDDRLSHTGYVFFLNNGSISWSMRKQTTVAMSTMEAEYVALSEASREAIARSMFLEELNLDLETPHVVTDNQGALSIASNPTDHNRAKHINVKYHFIRHAIEKEDITIAHVPGESQIADIFTKALPIDLHHRFCSGLRLFS